MRPLRVRMKGFGPFRDATEVDFSDVDLVGLVGPTGAGKSTILDAITFSLFGSVPRLDRRSVQPVVNALSSEAHVSFDFEFGAHSYTAVRVVRLTSGGGATTKEARLERDGEPLAATASEVSDEVERLLGMNFDRFTKVVFLPQGKFAEFLHDTPRDRQELLRTLLGLELYERVRKRAQTVAKEANVELGVLRPRVNDAGVDEDAIEALRARVELVERVQVRVGERLDARRDLAARLLAAETEAHEFGVLALAVDRVGVPQDVVTLGSNMERVRAELAAAVTAEQEAELTVEAAEHALAAEPERSTVERQIEGHVELEAIENETRPSLRAEVDAATTELDEALAAADDHRLVVEQIQAAAAQAESDLESAEAERDAGRDVGAVAADLELHAQVASLTEDHERLEAEFTHAEATAASDKEKAARAEAALVAARTVLRAAEQTRQGAVLAAALKVGDRCPVCDQTVHDLPTHAPAPELERAEAEVRTRVDEVAATSTASSASAHAAALLESRLHDVQARRQDAMSRAEAMPSLDQLEAERAHIDGLTTAVDEARNAARIARDEARNVAQSASSTQIDQRLEGARARLTRAQTQLSTLEDWVRQVRSRTDAGPSLPELRDRIARLDRLEAERGAARTAATAASADRERAAVAVDELERREDELRQEFARVRDGFVGLQPPTPQYRSVLHDWRTLADWAGDLREPLLARHRDATERAGRLRQELDASDREIQSIAAEVGDAAEPDATADLEVGGLPTRLVRLAAEAEAALAAACERREQLARDVQRIEELDERLLVHRALEQRLRSSGFEQWLLDEVFDGLVARAGERLHELSRGQYSLEAQGMAFSVRDHRNGDEVRDARTLSGGETFLASLALALALADGATEMGAIDRPPIGCLFIDEGFGTLDPETLDVVASAIEELGAGGRMIGVVTHIRDLAERLPVRFEVSRAATTSVVEKVYT